MPATEFDPHLAAQLHNQIFERAWVGAGRDVSSLPSKSWWGESSPVPFDLASRLNPKLIQFLRSAKAIIFDPSSDFHLFYYLIALHGKDDILDVQDSPLRRWGDDRLVWLYPSTRTESDEEIGILFDQETELASFVPDWGDLIWFDLERWPWRPLQCILQAYLDMIDEGKLTTYSDRGKRYSDQLIRVFPWEFHQYTPVDVERAVSAFTRLLDAIEARLPSSSIHHGLEQQSLGQIPLPYPESVLRASSIEVDSFTGQFLSGLPVRQLDFRYIAPGIRVQSSDEFINQPFAERSTDDEPSFPLLLFRGEQENKSPWVRPWFPGGNTEDIPAGLYVEPVEDCCSWKSSNDSRLLLPYEIGHSGFARSSNGLPFIKQARGGSTESDQLYRSDSFSGYSGYLPWDSRSSYLHKVLENWVDRVETGDWLVGEDGVVGGIEKFKEADTKEHWQEYVIPW
ncbi:hypothetical protein N7510_005258 [Penicillium lagena]|uniref:uncharacterized protein n=1 Tax=Penicillium lagena TaxID=94218 RepID=UPI00253F6FDA|nr:uncharacterized protein N7510_005258 [Penicillium lagena]KAJ5612064.1 hypothetical protein N7510_005258 [Penicillium lagena]